MRIALKVLLLALLFAMLTLLTQVGGILLLLYLPLHFSFRKKFKNKPGRRSLSVILYLAFYILLSLTIIPLFSSRKPLPHFTNQNNIAPLNICYALLNRNYVDPILYKLLEDVSGDLAQSDPTLVLSYLDTGFPYFDGYPLLPHLSHADGKKADLAFYYQDEMKASLPQTARTGIGYGSCEEPEADEINYPEQCKKQGNWQYNILHECLPGKKSDRIFLDQDATVQLIKLLANDKRVKRIFLEPHLVQRWGLQGYEKIRYHGCHAVRHDDHIHVEIY